MKELLLFYCSQCYQLIQFDPKMYNYWKYERLGLEDKYEHDHLLRI